MFSRRFGCVCLFVKLFTTTRTLPLIYRIVSIAELLIAQMSRRKRKSRIGREYVIYRKNEEEEELLLGSKEESNPRNV